MTDAGELAVILRDHVGDAIVNVLRRPEIESSAVAGRWVLSELVVADAGFVRIVREAPAIHEIPGTNQPAIVNDQAVGALQLIFDVPPFLGRGGGPFTFGEVGNQAARWTSTRSFTHVGNVDVVVHADTQRLNAAFASHGHEVDVMHNLRLDGRGIDVAVRFL